MGQDLSYNAPGLAILQQGNRYLQIDPTGAKIGLVALLGFSIALLLAPRFIGRSARWLVVLVAVAVVAWNLTGEISFAAASNRASDRFEENIRTPFTWVDDKTGGAPTLYIGQQMADQNGEWLTEFWNRSIKAVWSLDGTAQGPGPFLTPDHGRPTARSAPSMAPGLPVCRRGGRESRSSARRSRRTCIAPAAGSRRGASSRSRRRSGCAARSTGVYSDGWMGSFSAYTRYSTEDNGAGRMRIVIVPGRLGGHERDAGHVTVAIGPMVVGDDKQPHLGKPTEVKRFDIHSKEEILCSS